MKTDLETEEVETTSEKTIENQARVFAVKKVDEGIGLKQGAVEEEVITVQELKKPKDIETSKEEDKYRFVNIEVGDICVVSKNNKDTVKDLFEVLQSISKNEILMEYLRGEKKRLQPMHG